MPPRLILIRHGQAHHNVQPEDHTIPDPYLTSLGESQALSLRSHYPTLYSTLRQNPSSALIISSPFHRTIQTTLIGFEEFLPPAAEDSKRVKVEWLPQLQELGNKPCDTGADVEETKKSGKFPDWIDFSHCTPGWNSNEGFYAPSFEAQAERGKWVRKWIRERKEDVVIVVSHHGHLRTICKMPQIRGVLQWENAEAREYGFVDPTGQDDEADVERIMDAVL